MRGSKRAELQALFAANRHLFKTYVLCEQLDRLWTYKTRPGVLDFLRGWIKALRWQRLPEIERLGDSCSSTSRTSRRVRSPRALRRRRVHQHDPQGRAAQRAV